MFLFPITHYPLPIPNPHRYHKYSTGHDMRLPRNILIKKSANLFKRLADILYYQSERRDSNPRPPLPQSGALPSCATPRILNFRF